jgi:hypothetical protein
MNWLSSVISSLTAPSGLHLVGLVAVAVLLGLGVISVPVGLPLLTGLLGLGIGAGVTPSSSSKQ